MSGIIIAAPSSGSGKTVITLGLLRALKTRLGGVLSAKSGPDYIDPQFHSAAGANLCVNLDAWAMPPAQIRRLAEGSEFMVIEGAMGLFDGAPPDGRGSTADLARILDLPVVLVIDCARMAQSVVPIVNGFARHDPMVHVAGVILNRVGSARHEAMLRRALETISMPVLGAIHRSRDIDLPSRHLGLVQAFEHPDLENFLEHAGRLVENAVDIDRLTALARPLPQRRDMIPRIERDKKIAIAHDDAFSFTYLHHMDAWSRMGYKTETFSPLNDDPVPEADLVFLPGGYPELHAERLASASNFLCSLKNAAQDTVIYGECGGYMTLGESLTDATGKAHKMAGLLPLQTSFADRKLHLGYRHLHAAQGPFAGFYKGHEFHYATTLKAQGTALFEATDAEGTPLPAMGLIEGNVSGSFAHIIDRALPI